MPTNKGLPKGKAAPLEISAEGGRRFFVGLSWDPREMPRMNIGIPDKPKEGSKLGYYLAWPYHFLRVLFLSLVKLVAMDMYIKMTSKQEDTKGRDKESPHYDLDLACLVFDADFNHLIYIGPEDAAFIDASRKIYHSGEDQAGFGGPDDETVSVETTGLPENYHHFFFVVECDSKYSFEDIRNPFIRLADGKTNDNVIETRIAPPAHYNAHGLVFCHVWREGDGFTVRHLHEFTGDNMNWPKFLRTLVPGLAPLPEETPAAEEGAEADAKASGAA